MKGIGHSQPNRVVVLFGTVQHPLLGLRVDSCRSGPRSKLRGSFVEFDPKPLVRFVEIMKKTGRCGVCGVGRVDHWWDSLDVFR